MPQDRHCHASAGDARPVTRGLVVEPRTWQSWSAVQRLTLVSLIRRWCPWPHGIQVLS